MTTQQKLWQLVKRLQENTDRGTVKWEETPNKNALQAAFPKYGVRLLETRVPNATDYGIELLDETGRAIETATDVDLRDAAVEKGEKSYAVMKDLYVSARRKARGVEEAIDNILSSLE